MGFKVDFSQLEWGTVENRPRGRPEEVEAVTRVLDLVAPRLDGHVRVSRKGRPHIVLTRGSTTYSVSYSSRGLWYVFYPFPSWGAESEHLTFSSVEEVLRYFG